jgi:hypothetical protein
VRVKVRVRARVVDLARAEGGTELLALQCAAVVVVVVVEEARESIQFWCLIGRLAATRTCDVAIWKGFESPP